MFKKQMEKLTNALIKNGASKAENKEIIVYGLCSAIEIGFNIITTLVLGFLFGLVLEGIIFLISYAFLRTYVGGYHCEKAINCYFMSSGIIALVLAAVEFTPGEYTKLISIGILAISVPFILKVAPVESTHKPLDSAERKYYRKKTIIHLMIECFTIIVLFLVGINNVAYVICLCIMITALLVFFQMIQMFLKNNRNNS